MKLWFLFIVYGILILAIESVWRIPGNFLLLAVIFLSFHEEWHHGFLLSLFLGFLLDVTSLSPFGTGPFSFALVFGLVRFIKNKILFQASLSQFFWVMIFSLVYGILSRPFSISLPRLLLSSLVDASLSLFWLSFLGWYRNLTWDKLLKPRDVLLKK